MREKPLKLNLSTKKAEEEGRHRNQRRTPEAVADVEVDGDVEESSLLDSFGEDDEDVQAVLTVAAVCRGEVGDVDEAAAALGGQTEKRGRGERWRREGGEKGDARVCCARI